VHRLLPIAQMNSFDERAAGLSIRDLGAFCEASKNKFLLAQSVQTEVGARTMTVDLKIHRVLLPTADFGPAPPATPENPSPRPAIVPSSF
jgi:hypothetical protein